MLGVAEHIAVKELHPVLDRRPGVVEHLQGVEGGKGGLPGLLRLQRPVPLGLLLGLAPLPGGPQALLRLTALGLLALLVPLGEQALKIEVLALRLRPPGRGIAQQRVVVPAVLFLLRLFRLGTPGRRIANERVVVEVSLFLLRFRLPLRGRLLVEQLVKVDLRFPLLPVEKALIGLVPGLRRRPWKIRCRKRWSGRDLISS